MLLVTACALMIVLQMPRDAAQGRETQPAPKGTAVIRGKVTALDTGQPLRRAQVMVSGGPSTPRPPAGAQVPPRANAEVLPGNAAGRFVNRTVLTDAEGAFEFSALPAGTYRIRVTGGSYREHYLPMAFGARAPSDVGKPIELTEGQIVQTNFALPRGGAITGRVVDDFGEPVSRVMVFPSRVMAGGSFQRSGGGLNMTDDFGRFRLYGLEPGEYVVGAEPRSGGGPPIEGAPEGFAPTYYPSALNEHEAGRVQVSTGRESPDIELALVRTRTFRITGIIVDSQGATLTRANLMLTRRSRSGSGFSGGGSVSFDQSGTFTMRDVVPGDYQLIVRPMYTDPTEAPRQPTPRREFALVPLTVDADLDNLVITTRPGATISGRIEFAEGAPQPLPSAVRVMTEPSDPAMSIGSNPTRNVDNDMRFTLTDLFGAHYVRAFGFPRGYTLKAVMLGATDITDTPVEFKPEHSGHLRVIVTGRTSTLEGTVTDDRGEPASEVSILILPEEKASWRFGSPRTRITTATDGKFRLEGILSGRYHVVAISRDRLRPSRDLGPEIFEPFMKDATPVVIAEDETRTVDLRVVRE